MQEEKDGGFVIDEGADGERLAWIYVDQETGDFVPAGPAPEPGKLAFQVRYMTTDEGEKMYNEMIRAGCAIRRLRSRGRETFELPPERAYDRNVIMAKHMVSDWSGVKVRVANGTEPLGYTPELMVKHFLSKHPKVVLAIREAVESMALFSVGAAGDSSVA